MPRRIVRTTRRVQYNEDGEPIETVVSSTEEQPNNRLLGPGPETEVYEPDPALEKVTYTYAPPPTVQRRTPTSVVEVQDWGQSLRGVMQRQMQILREMDLRLSNLEDVNREKSSSVSFERATWWALWGILMLILGAALVVILLLIVNALQLGA